MPAPVSFKVATTAQIYNDGDQTQMPAIDRYGNARVVEYRGKYGEANSRGQVFHFCTPVAGVTLPIFSNTAQTYGIRNPPGSGVVLEIIRVELGYLSAADVPGDLVWTVPPVNAGVTATGSGGVTVATLTSPQSGQLAGAALKPTAKCSVMSTITTVAPTVILRTLGSSAETAVAASTNAPYQQIIYCDGTDLLYPGADLFLACTVAAGFGVNIVNVVGMEIPFIAGT